MSLEANSDFLSQPSEKPKDEVTPKKKRRTALEIEMDKYPEYYALNEYDRKCLVASNYWNIMNGNKIVEVPESDIHYHNYFDKRCYDLAEAFQKKKKLEKDNYEKKLKLEEVKNDEIQILEKEQQKGEVKNDEFEPNTTDGAVSPQTQAIIYKDTSEKKKNNNNLGQASLF